MQGRANAFQCLLKWSVPGSEWGNWGSVLAAGQVSLVILAAAKEIIPWEFPFGTTCGNLPPLVWELAPQLELMPERTRVEYVFIRRGQEKKWIYRLILNLMDQLSC